MPTDLVGFVVIGRRVTVSPFVENLDWDDRTMNRVLRELPRDGEYWRRLRLFNSQSRAELEARLAKVLRQMDVMNFATQAGDIDKFVGEKPDPVWRVVIKYRYEPYYIPPNRYRGPSQ